MDVLHKPTLSRQAAVQVYSARDRHSRIAAHEKTNRCIMLDADRAETSSFDLMILGWYWHTCMQASVVPQLPITVRRPGKREAADLDLADTLERVEGSGALLR